MADLSPDEIAALIAQRTGLKKAMRSGALSVQHGDKRVQYRSISEMQTVVDDINDELGADGAGKPKKRVFYIDGSRGY